MNRFLSSQTIALGAFIISACVAVWLGFTQPYMNWDLVGYNAAIMSWQFADSQALHEALAATLEADLPGWIYKQAWIEHPLVQNANALTQQLPFYEVKILYLGSMWFFHQFGWTLTQTTWIVSTLSMIVVFVLLYTMRPARMVSAWYIGIVMLCWLGPWPLASLARFSTPDALAMMCVLLALLAWLKWHNWILMLLFGVLAISTRPDCALIIVLFSLASLVPVSGSHRMPVRQAGIIMIVAVLTYWILNRLSGSYGWESWFIYSFVEKSPYPADLQRELSLAEYWRALSWNAGLLLQDMRFQCMAFVSLLACVAHYFKSLQDRSQILLLGTVWVGILLRFLVFPAAMDSRYYHVFYLLLLWSSIQLIGPYASILAADFKAYRQRIKEA